MYKEKTTIGQEKFKRTVRAIPIGHMLKFRHERADTLNQKLNDELLYVFEKLKMTTKEVESRTKIFELFKNTIESEFDCRVESHGSYRTGTMIMGSDIDITVLMNKKDGAKTANGHNGTYDECLYKQDANKVLARITQILEDKKLCAGPILHIRHARVPIIKCKDSKHACKIDIAVDKYDSIESANFVQVEMEKRPYLRYMVILLKYYLKRRHLSEVLRGGLCAYGQFLLLLSFVQLHPLLQDKDFDCVANLGVVLMDFFQFYGTEFPFENATISVSDAKYKPNRSAQINIEDPISPGHNVSSGCTNLNSIRELFSYSYKIMAAAFSEKVDTKKAIGELWFRIDETNDNKRVVTQQTKTVKKKGVSAKVKSGRKHKQTGN